MIYQRGLAALKRLRRRLAKSSNWQDLKGAYVRNVRRRVLTLPNDQAMAVAVGGADFEAIGRIETAILRHYGLKTDAYLIDVGCGSGRLAKPLSDRHSGPYLGTDVVPALLDYARRITNRRDWRFLEVDHIHIPEQDGQADMVCFFSVLTHLLHEQSYWYLQEAARVLAPGGLIVFSMIEFGQEAHWRTFTDTVAAARAGADYPLNVFIERSVPPIWAARLGLDLVDIRAADDAFVPEGHLGQTICVFRKPT